MWEAIRDFLSKAFSTERPPPDDSTRGLSEQLLRQYHCGLEKEDSHKIEEDPQQIKEDSPDTMYMKDLADPLKKGVPIYPMVALNTTIATRIAFRSSMYKRLFKVLEDSDVDTVQRKITNLTEAIEDDSIITKADHRRWEGQSENQIPSGETIHYKGMKAQLNRPEFRTKGRVLAAMDENHKVLNQIVNKYDRGLDILLAGLKQTNPSEVVKFMNALTLEIADDDWMSDKKYQKRGKYTLVQRGGFTCLSASGDEFVPGSRSRCKDLKDREPDIGYHQRDDDIDEHHIIMKREEAGGLGMQAKHDEGYVHSKELYRVIWCGVQGLFDGVDDDIDEDPWNKRLMEMLFAMETVPTAALTTPLAQALIRHHWNVVYPDYLFDRIVDAATLVVFFFVAQDLHTGEWIPRSRIFEALFALALIPIFKIFTLTIASWKVYGCKNFRFVCVLMNTYNNLFMLFDFITPMVLYCALEKDASLVAARPGDNSTTWGAMQSPFKNSTDSDVQYSETFPGIHPVYLFICIATRWIYVMMQMLNIEPIGRSILPVWESCRSKDTVVFMSYLLLASVGIFHAYYSFPIGMDDSDLGEAFTRVFRLFWMGDFDMFELEGVDGTVQGSISKTGSGFTADLTEDDGDHTNFKNGIRLFAGFAVFLGPILFMNTFITVLGDAYSESKNQINERFVRYRTNSLKLLLLRKLFCRNYLLMGFCNHQTIGKGKAEGVWFRLPNYCLEDTSSDDPVKLSQLQDVQTDLADKISDVQTDLAVKINESFDKMVAIEGKVDQLLGRGE